jgi:acyl dehydratase
MRLDPSCAGRTYPPAPPYRVTAEAVAAFADAIGDDNRVYRDPQAARGFGHDAVPAPPTFPIVLTVSGTQALVDDPQLGLDFARVVHGEQKFSYARPVYVGDELVAQTSIESIRSLAGNDMLTTRTEVRTVGGEPVLSARAVLVVREVGV